MSVDLEQIEKQMNSLDRRMEKLEAWRQSRDTSGAVAAEQARQVNQRLDKIDDDLREIKAATWKVVWIFATALILAFMTYVINGGLKTLG